MCWHKHSLMVKRVSTWVHLLHVNIYDLWLEVTLVVVGDFVSIHRWKANLAPLCWVLVLKILVCTPMPSVMLLYEWSIFWPSMQATHRPQISASDIIRQTNDTTNYSQCRVVTSFETTCIVITIVGHTNEFFFSYTEILMIMLWVHAIYQPMIYIYIYMRLEVHVVGYMNSIGIKIMCIW